MKKLFLFIFFLLIGFTTSQYSFSEVYDRMKCDWKEIKFDDKDYFDPEAIIEKSTNDMIFFSKITKYDNLILSYTSDLGKTWGRDSFLYSGNYIVTKDNKLLTYDRPFPRLNMYNLWTMFKRTRMVNIPFFIGDVFFKYNDSLLIAIPKYEKSAKKTLCYLINLNDSTSRPIGPVDSTGEIIEAFQHIRFAYMSNVPNRVCFINDNSEFYYSDNLGDSVTFFYQDPHTFIKNFPTKNGRFYYSKPGPSFYVGISFNGKMVQVELINVYIVRLNNENGKLDTIFNTYTRDNTSITNDLARLKNAGQYVAIVTNNDSVFFSDNYGDKFYYVPLPNYYAPFQASKTDIGISEKGEIILKWLDSTGGNLNYVGIIGKPYPDPYSVASENTNDYLNYSVENLQIVEFSNGDFINSVRNIALYNIYGQKIDNLEYNILGRSIQINTSRIPSGVYLLVLENNQQRKTLKLLINN
jgi:hypothetical protein